ncbi:hypothetical protein VitviT2T_027839 [Vitis vinifera]|uniref:Uncharacterized protein n=1 Tax=Vitis vinifera TaxID=29760 RepID=A0ABY9DU26_VITVI|nr:hypothetical protein VitviT2T_027839 [Vitis vinifera]
MEFGLPVDDIVVDEVPLRRSQRVCRPAISDDYMVYLQEHEYDGYDAFDPVTYQEGWRGHCDSICGLKGKYEVDPDIEMNFYNGKMAGAKHFAKAAIAASSFDSSIGFASHLDSDGH